MRAVWLAASAAAAFGLGAVAVSASTGLSPASDLEYVIAEPGDSYWRIAQAHNLACTYTELWAANGRAPLDPGTIVFVPPSCQSTTTPPTTEPPAPVDGFPTAATTGVPAGWTPSTTYNSDLTVWTDNAVIEDARVNGSIYIRGQNVTLRRVEVVGGAISTASSPTCPKGTLIEDTSLVNRQNWEPVVLDGDFTARRLKIDGAPEGIRVGGKDNGCGPVVIEDSWVRVASPASCTAADDWHGDGLQGYNGPALTVRNSYFEINETPECGGTGPFFYPSGQGNTSVDIDGLIVKGGGYPFRLGMPGPVRNLHIVDGSWHFGPIAVNCSKVTVWGAHISTLDVNGQPVPVRSQPCNTESGN